MRHAARALVVNAGGRVLLFRAAPPGGRAWWFAPGGALEPGESYAQALVRELAEETGLSIDPLSVAAPVWRREVMFRWQGTLERHLERFFLVRVANPDFEPGQIEGAGGETRREHRWWAVADIASSNDRFAPARFAEHLRPLLSGRLPPSPVDVGA